MKTLNNGSNILAGINALKNEKREQIKERVIEFAKENIVICHKQMTASGNPSVGDVTNKNTTHLALSFCPNIASNALIKHFELSEADLGHSKYVGLVAKLASDMEDSKTFCTDDKKVLITLINNSMVDGLIEEMKSCDLRDPENVKKILWDLTVIFRMYQELTIDAAKKCYIVDILIAVECVKPMSLMPVKHYMPYADEDDKEIDFTKNRALTTKNDKITIYQATPEKKLKDGSKRILFVDPTSKVQKSLAMFLEELVAMAYEIEVEMPEAEVQRLLNYKGDGPVEDLTQTVKYAYRTISIEYRETISTINREENEDLYIRTKEEYKRGISSLQTLAKQLLADYSPEEAASIMQYVACANAEGFNQESTNQIAVNLLSAEFLTMIVNTSAEIKVMGYKVLHNMGIKEGDVVNFLHGVSDDGSILDFGKEIEYVTGEFRIEKFKGSLYAVKDIVFDIAKADFSKRVFCVKAVKGRTANEVDAIVDALKEGSQIVVRKDGSIRNHDALIAEVKHEDGGAISKLLGVTGTVSYLKVVETEGYPTMIMFELENLEELESYTDEDIMPEIETDEIVVTEDEIDDIDEDLDAMFDDGIDIV